MWKIISSETAENFEGWGPLSNGFALAGIVSALMLIILGAKPYREKARVVGAFKRLGIKSGLDCTPRVLEVKSLGKYRKRLILSSEGLGIEHYKKKKGDMETIFNARVEDIKVGWKPRFLEIVLTTRTILRNCYYYQLKEKMIKVSSFLLGESLDGTMIKSLLDFPGGHLLIAGTSGGGKSNWFKSTLLGLLETTPRGEFFLLDFKGGVEFGPFGKFANVTVEKDWEGALRKLRMIVEEMNRRFHYLQKKERAFIIPEKDERNHLFVAIDEASLLYGKVGRSDAHFEYVQEARQLSNDIAKRGRAACISLILATQKITKETIDTSIQENITGRMCFRMNTFQGSMVVLGNKMGKDLPDIPGRAIWQCGNELLEVQAPLLRDKDIKKALEEEKTSRFFALLARDEEKEGKATNHYMMKNEIQGGQEYVQV